MELFKAIKTRRSIRAYINKKISTKQVENILEAGLLAPSSKNSQPWIFHVISRKEMIKRIGDFLIHTKNLNTEPSDPKTGKIKKGFVSSIAASGEIIKRAPLLIVIENTCPFSGGRANVLKSKYKNSINGHDSEFISLGAAIENMSLAAHALGLSSVIICDVIAEEAKIRNLLRFVGDLVAILPVGYPAYTARPRKMELKNKTRYIK